MGKQKNVVLEEWCVMLSWNVRKMSSIHFQHFRPVSKNFQDLSDRHWQNSYNFLWQSFKWNFIFILNIGHSTIFPWCESATCADLETFCACRFTGLHKLHPPEQRMKQVLFSKIITLHRSIMQSIFYITSIFLHTSQIYNYTQT